jgi:3-methyladenine DNA glycosylase/8-oxoguanine DNA glycosylase
MTRRCPGWWSCAAWGAGPLNTPYSEEWAGSTLFPGDDIGARNNLEKWMRLRKPLDYDSVAHVLRKWKPYGGLVYFHLLLDRLAKVGYLQPDTGSCLPRTPVGESKAG